MAVTKKERLTKDEANRILKLLGHQPLPKRVTTATVKAELKRQAKKLPLEKRQSVLDLIWKKLTFVQVAEQAGVTLEEAHGVLLLNTYTVTMVRRDSL